MKLIAYIFMLIILSPAIITCVSVCAFIGVTVLLGIIMSFFLITLLENVIHKEDILDRMYDYMEGFINRMKDNISRIYGR